jgi:hypothetical protein
MARPMDAKKFLKALRNFLSEREMEVLIDKRRGAGSHYYVVIVDHKTKDVVTLTLSDQKEISPGVQRRIVEWTARLAADSAIHAVVLEVLKRILGL